MCKSKDQVYKRREVRYKMIFDFLSNNPCIDCGESDPLMLSFDHISDKSADVCRMVSNGGKIEAINAEMDKCVVRCHNCHAKRTTLSKMSIKAKCYVEYAGL